jgi:hypothetical protein
MWRMFRVAAYRLYGVSFLQTCLLDVLSACYLSVVDTMHNTKMSGTIATDELLVLEALLVRGVDPRDADSGAKGGVLLLQKAKLRRGDTSAIESEEDLITAINAGFTCAKRASAKREFSEVLNKEALRRPILGKKIVDSRLGRGVDFLALNRHLLPPRRRASYVPSSGSAGRPRP